MQASTGLDRFGTGLLRAHARAAVLVGVLLVASCSGPAAPSGSGGGGAADGVSLTAAALSVAPVVRLTPASLSANGASWADANGGGVVFTAGAGSGGSRAPQLVTAFGQPALRFSGWQYMHGSLGDTASWNGVTIVAVFRTRGMPAQGALLSSGGGPGSPYATAGVRWVAGVGSDPVRGLGWAGATGSVDLGGGTYEPDSAYVMVWKRSRNGAGWTVRRNGVTLTPVPIADSSFPTGTFNALLGSEVVPNGAHAGASLTLYELHVYAQELDAADTVELEQELADTYHVGWYADGPTEAPDALLGSDLVAWYDAFDLTGAGMPVANWPNRAGNAPLLASGAAQPLLEADGIHGHPAVAADGVDDFMLATLDPPMPTGSRPHIWAVLRHVTPLPSTSYVRVGMGGSNVVSVGSNNGTSPNWLTAIRGASGLSIGAAAHTNDTKAHIVSLGSSANVAEHHLKVDGVSSPGTLDPGPASAPVSFVRLFSSENLGFANTRIGEVIVSRTTPTPEVDRAMHRYLAAKWRAAAPACGDGVIDPGEHCDDGNAVETDGCTSSCTTDPCAGVSSCAGGDGCCPAGCETGGDGDCAPLPSCNVENPCGNGQAGCVADHDCLPGLVCGIDAGPRFGHPLSAGGVCWNETACTGPVPLPCGSITAECGLCCEPRCGEPGQPDGCGGTITATDSDSDGAIDCADECPYDPTRVSAEPDGCNPPPCQGTPDALVVQFECVLEGDGAASAVFVVENTSGCVVDAPIGAQNRFLNGTDALGQPTRFQPGVTRVTITPMTGNLDWHLGNADSTAMASGPTCTRITELRESPVRLTAKRDGVTGQSTGDEQDTNSPVTFRIPRRLNPSQGFAGSGSAQLTFRTTGNQLVTCDYRGGAQTPNTSSEYDWARAQTYHFEGCSNGAAAGSLAIGTHFELDVFGGDGRFGETIVEQDLGPGCSGELDPPLWPEEVVALRTGFNWASTAALPTTDPQGLPAMRYVMLYVEDEIQIDGLEQAGVYFRQRPLFEVELARYDGQCGELGTASDDRGTFVYAILPATAYNLLRSEALGALAAGQEPPFRAILLPAIPDPAAANADGTLSWNALEAAAFDYYDRSSAQQQQPLFGFISDLVEAVGELVEDAWEAGTELVGFIDKAIAGSVRVRLDFTVINQDWAIDPALGTPMQRAWGPQRGHELVPRGMDVEILARDGVIPESFWGTIGNEGIVTIDVAKNSRTRRSGMCVHLENDAAMISRGVTEREICNFEVNHIFNGFTQDVPFHGIPVFTRYFNYMAQLTDGFDYMRAVLGRTPKQAEVLVGKWANNFGAINGNRAFVSCLDYAEMGFTATEFLNLLTGALTSTGAIVGPTSGPIGGGPVTDLAGSAASASAAALGAFGQVVGGPVLLKDIYLPFDTDSNHSRGVVTHEYGHFVMCDTYDESGFGELPLLYIDRINEGFDQSPDDTTAIAMEAFADLFALQVAGALNYVRTNGSIESTGRDPGAEVQFCTARPCIEENFRGRNESPAVAPYNDVIRRLVSTYHDAFDRGGDLAFTANVPTNGDPWVLKDNRLEIATTGGFLQESDDVIALSGPAMLRWLERGHTDLVGNLSDLAQTMYGEGFTWCEACELFAQHDPNQNFSSLPATRVLWEMCNQGELRQILGPPPSPSLNMNRTTCLPCPPGLRSNEDGVCVPCEDERAIVVDNECVPCPDGTIPNAQNECVPCADNEISVGLQCLSCVFGSKPNRATNTCESCPPAVVFDWAASLTPQCDIRSFVNIGSSDPLCPFVLEVRNVDVIPPAAIPTTHLLVQTFSNRDHSSCASSELDLHRAVEQVTPGGVLRSDLVQTVGGASCTESFCTGNCIYVADVFSATPQDLATDQVQHLRVLIDPASISGTNTSIVVTTGSCGPG